MKESLIKGGIPVTLSMILLICINYYTNAAIPVRLLDIFVSNLCADFLIICVGFYSGLVSSRSNLLVWYTKYGLSAIIMDTLIGVIYMVGAYEIVQRISSSDLVTFGLISIGLQWLGDLLFYVFFSLVPTRKNAIIDLFKDYAKEARLGALLGDTFLVIVAVLLSSLFNEIQNERYVVYVLIVVSYLLPYVVHTRTFETSTRESIPQASIVVENDLPLPLPGNNNKILKFGVSRSLGGI
jgi:hypothetical protein